LVNQPMLTRGIGFCYLGPFITQPLSSLFIAFEPYPANSICKILQPGVAAGKEGRAMSLRCWPLAGRKRFLICIQHLFEE